MAILLCIFILLFCAYQDLRFRGIHWFAFPLLFAAVLWRQESIFHLDMLWNTLMLAVLMLLLSVYLAIRDGQWILLTRGHFSWGDILFLLAMTPLFDPLSYVMFITIACLFSVCMHLLASMVKPQKTIPFAGYSALFSIWMVQDPLFIYRLLSFYEF